MGVRYIQASVTTLHRFFRSLKKTVTAPRNSPRPTQKTYSSMIGMKISRLLHWNGTLVASMTIKRAPKEKTKLRKLLVTFESVKIYFGPYVFFSREALSITELSACVVDSRM